MNLAPFQHHRPRLSPVRRANSPSSVSNPAGRLGGRVSSASRGVPPPSLLIQAKLRVGPPNDRFEQEADRVAATVMRMPETGSGAITQCDDPVLQRACAACQSGGAPCAECAEEESLQREPIEEDQELQCKPTVGNVPRLNPSVEAGIHALRGGGRPLPTSERAFFEPRMNADFSSVRVHTGPSAAQAAAAIQARAFTVGHDVFLGAGEYAPQTGSGRQLLAHELTHVMQQDGGRTARGIQRQTGCSGGRGCDNLLVQTKLRITAPSDSFKHPTDRLTLTALRRPEPGPDANNRGEVHNVRPALAAQPDLVRRKPGDVYERTNYAFDTGRATAAELQDPSVVQRFNDLNDQQLEEYREGSLDLAVIEFIGDILEARDMAKRNVVEQVVRNHAESVRKGTDRPGGACFAVARERVETATREVTGDPLTQGLEADEVSAFDRLWGVHITPPEEWLKLPEEFRGKGSAGAIAFAGKGRPVDQAGIWAGELEPGAVIQTWFKAADFERVKRGDRPHDYGHSFIFIRYVRGRNGTIVGMRIADQGYQSRKTLKPSAYGFWTAANILVAGPRPFVTPRKVKPEF